MSSWLVTLTTSTKEVVLIGISLLAGLHKKYSSDFHKIGGKVGHGPRQKRGHSDGNLVHDTLALG